MANRREKTVAEQYEEGGWTAVRGGWPDWLMVKVNNGTIVDCKCVEVKSPQGRLRYNQKIARKVLEDRLGAKYAIEVVE